MDDPMVVNAERYGVWQCGFCRTHHYGDVEECDCGFYPMEAYTNGKRVIVFGYPKSDLPDDESHNCDEMGCGSIGAHVLGNFTLSVEDNTREHRKSWHDVGLWWV